MKYAAVLAVIGSPAFADCPAGTDYSSEIVEIVENMRAAPSEASGRQYAAAMWDIWLSAPDALAQSMLDDGLAMMQVGDYVVSRVHFSALIDYCPAYAEGYNQRAFAFFLQGSYEDALVDLDVAIDLQPVHLGALTGKALTLIALGRDAQAQDVLRTALAINPWLSERALLDEPAGEDI